MAWWTALVITANAGAAAGQTAEPVTFEASGVSVILKTTPANPVVCVRLYLLGGTAHVTDSTAGVEPLLLRAKELQRGRAFARTGSRSILEATHDWTVTGFVGLRADLEQTWDVWAQSVVRSDFDTASFNVARGELLANARGRFSDPDRQVHRMAWNNLFRDHPYRFEPWGGVESLSYLTPDRVLAFGKQMLVTSRMLLVIVGDVARETAEELVGSSLGRLPRGEFAWMLPSPITPTDTQWRWQERDLPTNYVLAYFVGPPPGHDDYFAFELATRLLSSRLFNAIRSERGLSYAADAPFILGGVPVGGMYASTAVPGEVIGIMRRELVSLTWADYSLNSLGRFVNHFILDDLARSMTTDNQAADLARAHLYFGDVEYADEYYRRLRGIRSRALQRVAKEYMVHLQLAFLGDPKLMEGKW